MKLVEPWKDFEPGTKVSAKRYSTWIHPSACIAVPPYAFQTFAEIPAEPQPGDVLLAEVTALGSSTFVEDFYGCCIPIFPGSQLLTALAPAHTCAEISVGAPAGLSPGAEIELLNTGGTLGRVVAQPGAGERLTEVVLRSCFSDASGRTVNVADFGKRLWRSLITKGKQGRTIIGVTNAAAEDRYQHDITGWSSATKAMVYALASAGHTVTAGRVTGNAARRELRLLRAAGAAYVADYVQLGYPTTHGLDETTQALLFWQIYQMLVEESCPGGFVILEFCDSFFSPVTAQRLRQRDVRETFDHLVISGRNVGELAAAAGRARRELGYRSVLLSTPGAGGRRFSSLLAQHRLSYPCFDPLVVDIAYLSALLQGKSRLPAASKEKISGERQRDQQLPALEQKIETS